MVHSGSASPMNTTPSASPHLTTAPPLVSPSGGTTDQDLTQSPTKLLTAGLTSNSDQAQPPTHADAEQHVVIAAKSLSTKTSSESVWSSEHTSTPVTGAVNGRTSGRKRTPKSCDCCGPNSTGHNARTSGKGRGRGRVAGRDLGVTPKRKVDQLTQIKSFDLTREKVEEVKDEDNMHQNVQIPVAVPLQEEPIRNYIAPEKGDSHKKEDALIKGSGVSDAVEKGGADYKSADVRLVGTVGSGLLVVRGQGRGMMKATSALNMEGNTEIKKGGGGGAAISSKTEVLVPPVVQREMQDAQMHHRNQNDPSSVNCLVRNGDMVNLSDTDGEEENDMIVTEPGNVQLSISWQSGPASRSGTPQDHDSEMQVDQIPDRTDQVLVPIELFNGNITTPTDHNHESTSMEVESSHPAMVSPPDYCPVTVSSMQHGWALRDHRLYCQPGTWEKDQMDETLHENQSENTEMNGKMQNQESLEHLTDTIHEFLESFYIKYGSFIPLSESDVQEHLKKEGKCDLSNSGLDIKREMARYRSGLASAPVAGFMVMYNKHTLRLEDLSTLEEQNWLNDQIINMYGELIMEATEHKVHFFNSFFHKQLVAKGYDGVKRWTKKVDLFSKWLLLIPIHLEIHWSLVTVTMATKTINYYDSQGIVFRHTTDNIMKYLQSEAREKKQTAFQKGWKITIIKGIPQQKNDSDCGVFVLEYCRRLSVKQPLLFSQDDMPRIRKQIYKELCDCRLND
ncbi:uncharacterized protein LOC115779501 isoform X1 [Archocentrus centrarchus]|uniref:uncharacterized protein LOC115779501 isoform X1 n=1 Tax=Archocentrus centrarchus TaxID=63155 RepID=UPI0011E9B32C|nr:uncharacterized protein LOC115779501 isoform X1 [Archocentrus centrarchus]XP_030584057.1 uncharacterized protein LOC115779501 isoform X1 [Archocentrus centrarchus]XP_030584058.1 uncharacterized protein LOC115779501 isoform X1 [Archocentrus centrarchus]